MALMPNRDSAIISLYGGLSSGRHLPVETFAVERVLQDAVGDGSSYLPKRLVAYGVLLLSD